VAVGGLVFALAACHGLLDVSDPTLVQDKDIANAAGANARRLDASNYLNTDAPDLMASVAIITDEWISDRPLNGGYDLLDKRDSQGYESAAGVDDRYLGTWDRVYYATSIAIPPVRAYTPDSLKSDFLGQLYGIRGYAVLQIAEDVCPGFPLNDVSADNRPLYSGPLTTDSALVIANAQLDSAVKYAHDSTRFVTLARVAKGRALLDQGKYAEAAAVVASVQTAWVYQTEFNLVGNYMSAGNWSQGGYNYAVGDSEGGNGLPFASANDPRISAQLAGTGAVDTMKPMYITVKYPDYNTPVTLASGVEARLIEAEAALHAGDPSWLTTLNTLRATAISPSLPALSDPGTAPARVDLLYHERAFWLYLTGRRLGDLRRLIRNYGRDPETVFPTGAYPLGDVYKGATAIPFILAGQPSNPRITQGCTTR